MKALFIIFVISLSLATIGEVKAETKKVTSSKKIKPKVIEDKKPADCETTEELKKKIEAKPHVVAPTTEIKSDGFSLKGASTGCSL